MPRPKGRPLAESHTQAIRNAKREPSAQVVEQADAEAVKSGLVRAIREGRIAPKVGPQIMRLMPPMENAEGEEDAEAQED